MKRQIGLLLLALSLLASCNSPTNAPAPQPTPWRASIGTYGGVTGGGGGLEIWSDGSAFTHRRDDPQAALSTSYLGRLDQDVLNQLTALLHEATTITHQQYENMTTSLLWQGLEHDFRHDWSWEMGDRTIPGVLRTLEATLLRESLDLMPGAPGRADLFVAVDGSFTLTLTNANGERLRAGGRDATVIGELNGMTLELLGADGHLTIDDVQHGWVSGSMVFNGQESSFRLPTWLEVAP